MKRRFYKLLCKVGYSFNQSILYLDDKITDYYKNYSANAHRGDYDLSLKVDYEYENARDLVKDFIKALLIKRGPYIKLDKFKSGLFNKTPTPFGP